MGLRWAFAVLWTVLVLLVAPGAWAQSAGPESVELRVERMPEGIYLAANLKFELPQPVEDALLKGVPMFFVAEAEVSRERWYWTDKRLPAAERHLRLAFQPLTRRWRLNVASGTLNSANLGLALGQSFDSLPEALSAVQRLPRWKIADMADLDGEGRYKVEFRFRLDLSQLPRPLQIGAFGQSDWNLSLSSSQRLSAEGIR
jgi:hypothetical protein